MGPPLTRRGALKAAATIGITSTAIGLAAGRGAPQGIVGGQDPCEGCGALLTKYEWEDGEFVWEKGRDSLGINGDEFDITVTEYNEDGEPLCIEVDSIVHPKDNEPIYDFSCSTVKSGQDIDKVNYDWASGFEHCQEKYAISNFALCINEVFWQWDWGTGPAVDLNTEDPNDKTWYQANNNDPRHLLAARQDGGDVKGAASFESIPTDGNGNPTLVENVTYRAVDGSTLAIDFDVVGSDQLDLHLTSQELPGPAGDNWEIPWGPMYDIVEGTYSGTGNTMTVDIPTL